VKDTKVAQTSRCQLVFGPGASIVSHELVMRLG